MNKNIFMVVVMVEEGRPSFISVFPHFLRRFYVGTKMKGIKAA